MPASQARAVIEEELGGLPLEEVFDWIDLEEPLGSASIAQVPVPCSSTMQQRTWLTWPPDRDLWTPRASPGRQLPLPDASELLLAFHPSDSARRYSPDRTLGRPSHDTEGDLLWIQETPPMQVHKGRLRVVPQENLPLDIRVAAKRQRRTFNSWQLGLGPEVLYTPSPRSSHPTTLPPGTVRKPLPANLVARQAV